MNSKKLAFNISIAGAGLIAVVTYFTGFFTTTVSKYYGSSDLLGFKGNFGMAELFKLAINYLDSSITEEIGIAVTVFLILCFIIPSILALLNAGLGFALKPKGAGVFSIITGAIGLISASCWFVVLEQEIDFGLSSYKVSDMVTFGWGGYVNIFMFVACLVCGILMIALVKNPVEEAPQEGLYEPPYDGGYNQPYDAQPPYDNGYNQPYGAQPPYDNGYNQMPNSGGYDNASDVTVKLNQDYGSFKNTPNSFPAGTIFCVNGKYRGISFPISHGERINIGRDPKQCNIIIGEESIYVGRKHCNIVYFADVRRYEVTVSSSNGIILANGKKVRTGEKVRLPAGTTIALGNNDNVFELR